MTTPGSETKTPANSKTSPTTSLMITSGKIAEMCQIDNSSNLLILPVGKVMVGWTGHILDRDDGKWADWSYNMNLELLMVQLWEYVFNAPNEPHAIYKPHTH